MTQLKLMVKFVCVGILFVLFGAMNVFAAVSGSVNEDNVNVRSKNSTDSDVVAKANSGQTVTVYLLEGDFYKVSFNGKDNVYIAKQFVSLGGNYGVVSGAAINVRKAPSLEGQVAGKVHDGHYLGVSAREGDWYEITYFGAPAYVHKDYLAGSTLANVKTMQPEQVNPVRAAEPQIEVQKEIEKEIQKEAREKEPQQPDIPPQAPAPQEEQRSDEAVQAFFETPLAAPQQELPVPDPDRIVEYSVEPPVIELANASEDSSVSAYEPIYAFCNADPGLNLRSGPSTGSEVLIVIDYGEVFDVLEIEPQWIKVNFYGQTGYVNADYIDVSYGVKPERKVKAKTETSRADEVVAYAKQFLGTPYVYGGSSLNSGVDCSGFVYSVMKNFGVKLNRSASSMTVNGRSIAQDELRTGDLVFFAANGVNVSHVAIYIGGGQYIHSTDSGGRGVSYGNLYDNYASRTYHSSRRVIE